MPVATVLNVNEGHNPGLMAACEALAGYARFVGLVRAYNESMPLADAIRAAMRRCIREGVLADYFRGREEEVVSMILEEWDAERQAYLVEVEKRRAAERERREGLEQGREQGREEKGREMLEAIASLVRDGVLDESAAASRLDPDDAEELARMLAGGE